MNVLDLRVTELALPYLPEISFSGEYAKEIGDGKDGEIDAEGWYAGLTYAPAEWPWTPSLSYRYSYFSGDPDPKDTIRRDFDPLFYGWTGWGTWYQGEITGEWLLFNSNSAHASGTFEACSPGGPQRRDPLLQVLARRK